MAVSAHPGRRWSRPYCLTLRPTNITGAVTCGRLIEAPAEISSVRQAAVISDAAINATPAINGSGFVKAQLP